MAKLAIVVRLQFSGIHSWPTAPADRHEAYLAHPHRHVFHVEAVLNVTHVNRDVEFIAFKQRLLDYVDDYFAGPHHMSCEEMALRLLDEFGLSRCSVFEDNENGAEVTA